MPHYYVLKFYEIKLLEYCLRFLKLFMYSRAVLATHLQLSSGNGF